MLLGPSSQMLAKGETKQKEATIGRKALVATAKLLSGGIAIFLGSLAIEDVLTKGKSPNEPIISLITAGSLGIIGGITLFGWGLQDVAKDTILPAPAQTK